MKKIKIDNKKTYRFYFCNIKTTIVRNSANSHGKSYFDFERAKKPKIDNGFGRRRTTTGSFTESLNIQMGEKRQYSFIRETNRSPIIDSPFDSESELGIRNPVYDINYGRELPDPPAEGERLTPDRISNTYATIDDAHESYEQERPERGRSGYEVVLRRPAYDTHSIITSQLQSPIEEDNFKLRSWHKILIILTLTIGNVLHKQPLSL